MTRRPAPPCPKCGGASKPIVYGLPSDAMYEAKDRGEIVFGGCIITDDSRAYRCKKGHEFGPVEFTSEGTTTFDAETARSIYLRKRKK